MEETNTPKPKLHSLKTIDPFYGMLKSRIKTFEIRKNDRNFKEGDYLELQEFVPKGKVFTGKRIFARVTKVLAEDLKFCLKQDFVVLCIKFREDFSLEEENEIESLMEDAE